MKKLLFIISVLLVVSSCSATKETKTARIELKNQKKAADEIAVRKAVESGRYIIKLDRIYLTGGTINLIPRANYIIVDGRKAIISATYFGRQYDIRPIAGINVRGIAADYKLTSKSSKGLYEVTMKVEGKSSAFDVYLTIGKDGNCNASVNSLRIQNVRYRGFLVPIDNNVSVPLRNSEVI